MLFLNLAFSIVTMAAMILISPLIFVVIKSSRIVNEDVQEPAEHSSEFKHSHDDEWRPAVRHFENGKILSRP